MTLRTRILFTATFALGLSAAASAQQWGPSAQSRVYHNLQNPQTLTAYNTEAYGTRPAAQTAPAPVAAPRTAARTSVARTGSAGQGATAARRRTSVAVRPTASRQSGL